MQLIQSYQEKRPVAILVGDSRFGSRHVLEKFLEGVGTDTTIVRIDGNCADPKEFMRQVVRSAGFESKEMSLDDLEKVFELYLQYQRTHRERTIIVVQNSDALGQWVLDKIRQLVELEAEEKFGLKIVLSRPPSDISVINDPVLESIIARLGERIDLSPFPLAETRKYVSRYAESVAPADGGADVVSRVFEFMAVTLIHEICAGVPDDVHRLCCKSFDIYQASGSKLISTDTVKQAAAMIGLTSPIGGDQEAPVTGNGAADPVSVGRLVIATLGTPVSERLLDQNCFLIGRDQMCNIRIHGLRVSRMHAAISMSTKGVHVADLGSQYGTAVNGQKVERFELQNNDVITIGDTRISYRAGSEQLTLDPDPVSTDSLRGPETESESEPSITYLGEDMRSLRSSLTIDPESSLPNTGTQFESSDQ
jgi:pSer/pThr/pTyr-binding forkhead associated (FHA) protein/type II secretory pathway predicted ATPase ExeA